MVPHKYERNQLRHVRAQSVLEYGLREGVSLLKGWDYGMLNCQVKAGKCVKNRAEKLKSLVG